MNSREPRPIQWKSSLVSPFWRHLWITHATPFALKFRLFQRAKTKLLLTVLLQYLSYFKCECVNGIVFDSEKPVICGSKGEKRISGKNLLLWWVEKLGERQITTSDTLPINCRRPVTNQLRSGNNFIMTRGNWEKKICGFLPGVYFLLLLIIRVLSFSGLQKKLSLLELMVVKFAQSFSTFGNSLKH